MTDEIRQNDKVVLLSKNGFSIPMSFNNLCGKNSSGEEYRDYIKYIALGEMGFKPGIIELYRGGVLQRTGEILKPWTASPESSTTGKTEFNDLQIWRHSLFTRRKPISATNKTLRHCM